jgi:hypothetical protein
LVVRFTTKHGDGRRVCGGVSDEGEQDEEKERLLRRELKYNNKRGF